MKTIIIAFWERNHAVDEDSDIFRLGKGEMHVLKQGRAVDITFKESDFLKEKKESLKEKLAFIYGSTADKFATTDYQTLVLVFSEKLREDFLRMIRYRKREKGKPAIFPSIPGEQFGDDDRILVLIQDKETYGPFPVRVLVSTRSDGTKQLDLVNPFTMN